MEAHARAPDPLTKSNDMASNWHSWKEDFIIFMKVTGYIDKPNEIRANLLKNRIGKIGIDAIQTMIFDNPQDKDDMDILIAKLEEFFDPPKNEMLERYQFFTRDKKTNETIEQYINILKEKAKTCNFNDMTDSIIRDKIILITHDKILRKKLFETKNLDLQKLVTIYNDYNINTEKMKEVSKEQVFKEVSKEQVSKEQVSKESAESSFCKISCIQKPPIIDPKKKCWKCNCQHPQGKCPAWGSKCTKCGDVNHFTQCCKGVKPNLNNTKINNLLNPKEQAKVNQTVSKSNNKRNRANSKVQDMDSINKMINFPDTPVSYTVNSNFDNDFVIVNGPGTGLHSDNAKD